MASFLRNTFDNFVNNINQTLSNQNSSSTPTRPNRQTPRGATPSGASNTRNHTPRSSNGRPPTNTASDYFRILRRNFASGPTESRPTDHSARSSSQPPAGCAHRRQQNCPYHSHSHQRDQQNHRHHNQQSQPHHHQQQQQQRRVPENNMSSSANRNTTNTVTAVEKLDIGDVRDPSDINDLSAKQLKIILTRNCVDYKGVFEKEVLREKVLQLWIDCNEKKFSGNKSQNQTGQNGSQQNSDDIDESLACKICMEREINCVLLECGHMLTCVTCGRKLTECPICRQNVSRVKNHNLIKKRPTTWLSTQIIVQSYLVYYIQNSTYDYKMVRVKRRYIVLKVRKKRGKDDIDEHELMDEIKNQVEEAYGDFGMACLKRGFSMKKFDHKDGFAIIQVRKGVHEMIMSAIPLITRINDKDCTVNILHLSGTLRCSLKVLRLDYIHNLRALIAEKIASETSNKLISVG